MPLFYLIARVLLPRRLRLRLIKYRGGHFGARVALSRALKGMVVAGPFARLAYGSYSIGSEYFPKLLGTYELELHATIEKLVSQHFERVVVVGAGEGYYSCGLALRCPAARVVSFESDPAGQDCQRAMAARAGISARIEILGFCDRDALQRVLDPAFKTLLWMDVEGAEDTLLDLAAIPALRHTTVLVELHDCFIPGLRQSLQSRFAQTHQQVLIDSQARSSADFPALTLTGAGASGRFLPLLDEARPGPMQWLLLTPVCSDANPYPI